jgi:hypothetical protein
MLENDLWEIQPKPFRLFKIMSKLQWESDRTFTWNDDVPPLSFVPKFVVSCEPHRKHLFLYCCIYSALHCNGSCPIFSCVFVAMYCFRLYPATGCCLAVGRYVTVCIYIRTYYMYACMNPVSSMSEGGSEGSWDANILDVFFVSSTTLPGHSFNSKYVRFLFIQVR